MPPRKKQKGPTEPESPGKFMITIGGFLGFVITMGVSFVNGGDPVIALVIAMFACLVCAFIMKLFACYVEKNIDEMLNRKADEIRARREREEAEEEGLVPISEESESHAPQKTQPLENPIAAK